MNEIHSRIGDSLDSLEVIAELPDGATIVSSTNTGRVFEKRRGRWYDRLYGGTYDDGQIELNSYEVNSLPEGLDYAKRPAVTVERFMWKFRTGAMQHMVAHGASETAVLQALADMGITPDRFPIGPGIRVYARHDTLPEGTLVFTGKPDQVNSFGVFAKTGHYWQHVLGENPTLPDGMVTVAASASVTEPPDWWTREGSDEDEEAIKAFKARAWRVGYKLKRSQGWCGTYEEIARQLGITAADLNHVTAAGVRVGESVSVQVARMLPHGTLLRWQSEEHPELFSLVQRVPGTGNRAGTLRLYGSETDGMAKRSYHPGMTVVWLPDGGGDYHEVNYRLVDEREWPLLPPGTHFAHNEGSSTYVICRDGSSVTDHNRMQDTRVTPETGPYGRVDFGQNPRITVVRTAVEG